MKNKPVDINQRIPLETLHSALLSFLNNNYSEEYILEQLRLDFSGENRLKKALRIVNKIVVRSPIAMFIERHENELKLALKKKHERNCILISLLNSAYPFSFDTFRFLGKFFMVQDLVNRETLVKSLSGIYGGNRATENAFDSVIPMFLEAGLIERPQLGIYKKNDTFRSDTSVAKKIYIESYRINSNLEMTGDYQLSDPYFYLVFK